MSLQYASYVSSKPSYHNPSWVSSNPSYHTTPISIPNTLTEVIANIPTNQSIISLTNSYGLAVNNVSWEDTGRSKGSCWGKNITDMTLCCNFKNMPVFRKPNFADVTADRPLSDFTVMVGNESGSPLKQITLKEYLLNIQLYTKNTNIKSLFLERDNTILTSAQACILPLTDGSVEFCVKMYNYQSNTSADPAILVIMSGAQGTSAQVVYGQTSLYFNDNEDAYNMKADRLTDDRKKRGVRLDGPMSEEEKNRNALFIYQIPLKQQISITRSYTYEKGCPYITMNSKTFNTTLGEESFSYNLEMANCSSSSGLKNAVRSRGLEKAVLSRGQYINKFTGTNNLTLERDERFPIRCTVQYYNVTDSAEVTEIQIKEISETIANTYKTATATGSLVLNNTSDRPTEPVIMSQFIASSNPLVKFL